MSSIKSVSLLSIEELLGELAVSASLQTEQVWATLHLPKSDELWVLATSSSRSVTRTSGCCLDNGKDAETWWTESKGPEGITIADLNLDWESHSSESDESSKNESPFSIFFGGAWAFFDVPVKSILVFCGYGFFCRYIDDAKESPLLNLANFGF